MTNYQKRKEKNDEYRSKIIVAEQLALFDMGGDAPVYETPADAPSGILAPARTVPQEVIDQALYTGGNEPNSAERIPCHSFIQTGSPAIRMRWMPFETALRAVRMIFCGKESKKNIEIPRSPYILIPVLRPWFAERSLSGWPAGIGR